MNIFVLDYNPRIAASYHCDKHVVKMIVESCQILASSIYRSQNIFKSKDKHLCSDIFSNFPRLDKNGNVHSYGIGYIHHPCIFWTSETRENYLWVIELLKGLCEEYSNIYHGKIHKCQKIIFDKI